MKKFLAVFAILAASGFAQAQDQDLVKYQSDITKEELSKHLHILASDEYEGRETGQKGQKMAAEYIQKHFESLKLAGPVNTGANPYYQGFELEQVSMTSFEIKTKGGTLKFVDDFLAMGAGANSNGDAEVVFAGYGIEDEKYNDYKNLDVKGKYVAVFMQEPKDKNGKPLLSGDGAVSEKVSYQAKVMTARTKGAKGVIFLFDDDATYKNRAASMSHYLTAPKMMVPKKAGAANEEGKNGFAMMQTSFSAGASMMGTTAKALKKAMKKSQKSGVSAAGKFKASVNILLKEDKKMIPTENVLGYIEGTDKKEEVLIITAHYDHIGIIDGEVHNGADDDGSGTSAVLELAESFAKAKAEGKGPRRSILFMAVTGEEKGLLGSEYYSENPIFPLKNTVTNLNIDMIGRMDPAHEGKPDYVYIIGSDMLSTDLHKIHEEQSKKYAAEVAVDYTFNSKTDPNQFYYRSDHYNFAKHNIPIIFYFNGTHADYHKASDEVDKIHFGKMEKITRLVFATAWELANRENKPVVDKQ